jgi:hypothetical protein
MSLSGHGLPSATLIRYSPLPSTSDFRDMVLENRDWRCRSAELRISVGAFLFGLCQLVPTRRATASVPNSAAVDQYQGDASEPIRRRHSNGPPGKRILKEGTALSLFFIRRTQPLQEDNHFARQVLRNHKAAV